MSGGTSAESVLERVAERGEFVPPDVREAEILTDEQVTLERRAREELHETRSSVSETVPAPVFERRSFRSAGSLPPSSFREATHDVLQEHDRGSCSDCGGRGESACGACGGDGRRSCPTCDGSGRASVTEPCRNCDGAGTLRSTETCSTCQGSGERLGDGVPEPCPDCRNGRVEVETTCRECGGTGSFERREPCTDCGGEGGGVCDACGGGGESKCTTCNGSGATVSYTAERRSYTVETVEESLSGPGTDGLVGELEPADLEEWTVSEQSVETDPDDAVLARDVTHTARARHVVYRYRGEPHHAFVVGDRVMAPDAPEITARGTVAVLGAAALQFLPIALMAGAVGAFLLTDIRPLYLGAVFFGAWGVLLYDPF